MIEANGYADQLRGGRLSRSNHHLRGTIERLSEEAVTGRVSNPLQHLGGNTATLAGVEDATDAAKAETRNLNHAATRLTVIQNAMAVINGLTDEVSSGALTENSLSDRAMINIRSIQASSVFDTAVGKLRVQHGNDYVFSGQAIDQASVPNAEELRSQIAAATSGLTSNSAITAAIDDWLTNPASGLVNQIPINADTPTRIIVDGELNVDGSASARSSAVMQSLKGLAMMMIASDRPDIPDDQAKELMNAGAQAGLQGSFELRRDRAQIGVSQERVEETLVRKETETDALNRMRNDLTGVDQYAAASNLAEYRASLERLYAITARLNSLSLVNFLR